MDYKHIEDLLEKYWACETSIVEEKELKAFFQQNEVPGHLKETAMLFRYYEEENSQKKLGTDFDQSVMEGIVEGYSQKEGKVKVVNWFNNYARVAAVIALLVVVAFAITRVLNQEQQKVQQVADTYENPEDAFEETKKALLLISTKIGKGKKEMTKLSEFNKAEEKIRKDNEVEL